jgi:hypothetical protein
VNISAVAQEGDHQVKDRQGQAHEVVRATLQQGDCQAHWAVGQHGQKMAQGLWRPSSQIQKKNGFTKLRGFEGALVQALKADAHRPKHDLRGARALLTQLQLQVLGYGAATAD